MGDGYGLRTPIWLKEELFSEHQHIVVAHHHIHQNPIVEALYDVADIARMVHICSVKYVLGISYI